MGTCIHTWGCAKTLLTQLDRKGDHLIRIPMQTPKHTPMHAPMQ